MTWIIPIGVAAALTTALAITARRGARVFAATIGLLAASLLFAAWRLGTYVALEDVRCGPRCGHGASLGFVWIGVAIGAISVALRLRRPATLPARALVAFALAAVVLCTTLDVWVA